MGCRDHQSASLSPLGKALPVARFQLRIACLDRTDCDPDLNVLDETLTQCCHGHFLAVYHMRDCTTQLRLYRSALARERED